MQIKYERRLKESVNIEMVKLFKLVLVLYWRKEKKSLEISLELENLILRHSSVPKRILYHFFAFPTCLSQSQP